MQKNQISKILAIGIIVLFIGVSISSAISIDAELGISTNESEECKECQEVSDADLVKVERLLYRVEVYSKLLLVLSRNKPEIQEEIEELLDLINPDSLWNFPIICNILNGTLNKFAEIWAFFVNWIESTEEGTFEFKIAILCFEIFVKIIEPIAGIMLVTGILLGCFEPPPHRHLC